MFHPVKEPRHYAGNGKIVGTNEALHRRIGYRMTFTLPQVACLVFGIFAGTLVSKFISRR